MSYFPGKKEPIQNRDTILDTIHKIIRDRDELRMTESELRKKYVEFASNTRYLRLFEAIVRKEIEYNDLVKMLNWREQLPGFAKSDSTASTASDKKKKIPKPVQRTKDEVEREAGQFLFDKFIAPKLSK